MLEDVFVPRLPTSTPPPLASLAPTVASIQSAPAKAAEAAAALRKSRASSVERVVVEPPKSVEQLPSSSGHSDEMQLVEMGRRLLGGDSGKENVFLVTLVRPDGSSGGGVGIVLTGGADYENNTIKVFSVVLLCPTSIALQNRRMYKRILIVNG